MSSEHLTIFVCSDFHAFDGSVRKNDEPSWFNIQSSGKGSVCPVAQLLDYIKEKELRADLAVFCGDLGDKAFPVATTHAWQKVHEISQALQAKVTIATAGNHDLDSRHEYNNYDAKGYLQSLTPGFPSDIDEHFNRYWARHFYFICEPNNYRILVLNSAAYHGFKDEYEHGRISSATLEQIFNAIRNQKDNYPINICICHHSPHKQAESAQGESDEMKGGDDLVEKLGNMSPYQWLIIHGHKHYPKLQYARGSVDSPTILSCGSISAIPYPVYGRDAKNQVHFVEFDLAYVRNHGLHGIVKTYEWASGSPWRNATREGGLPAICGFGNRLSTLENAQRIAELIKGKLEWDDLVKAYPDISYLPGNSLSNVFDILENQLKIMVLCNRNNEPIEIFRM